MYELRVLTGLHRGAALPLIGQQWNLGNEEDADLVLFDPGIKPKHCHLIQLENGWSLEGEQGKITDAEGHKVDNIEHLAVNASFALSGVWLSIVDASTPWPQDEEEFLAPEADDAPNTTTASAEAAMQKAVQKPKKSKGIVQFILGFVSASAIVATSTWASLSPPSNEDRPITVEPEQLQPEAQLLPSLSSALEVKNQLRGMLRERELDTQVQVSSNTNQVFVTGSIEDTDLERVRRMIKRFHKQFHTDIEIANQTDKLPMHLPFKIVQITSGSLGSVVTNTGKRLFVGDELDGMRLVSVSENKVIFKGKQDYEVNW